MLGSIHRRRLTTAATIGSVGALVLLCGAPAVLAADAPNPPTWAGSGTPAVKPDATHSYVISSDKQNMWDGATPYGGVNYPDIVSNFPGAEIDVLMQQCFGGGFAKGINAEVSKPWTLTAATNWNELAWNTTADPPNNFTRAWIDSFPRPEGLYTHYRDATAGAAAIVGPPPFAAVVQDPYAPGGPRYKTADNPKRFENPSFASPDALVGGNINPTGTNNGRDIVGTDTFAVLIATQPDAIRFDRNINRVYNALTGRGVPANQIVVLFGNQAKNSTTAGGTPVNGPISVANFQSATSVDLTAASLFGNLTGQSVPAGIGENAHFFLYNTGHGDSWTPKGGTTIANPGTGVRITEKPANGFIDPDGSDSNLGTFTLELAFAQDYDPTGLSVTFDGLTLTSIVDAGTTPQVDLSPMLGTTLYYWDIEVPISFFNLSPSAALPYDDITINGLDDAILVGVTYDDYGDAWSVGVPEPATLTFVIAAASTGLLRRRRRDA